MEPPITLPQLVDYYQYRYDPPDACQNVMVQFKATGVTASAPISAGIFAEASVLSVS